MMTVFFQSTIYLVKITSIMHVKWDFKKNVNPNAKYEPSKRTFREIACFINIILINLYLTVNLLVET